MGYDETNANDGFVATGYTEEIFSKAVRKYYRALFRKHATGRRTWFTKLEPETDGENAVLHRCAAGGIAAVDVLGYQVPQNQTIPIFMRGISEYGTSCKGEKFAEVPTLWTRRSRGALEK